MQGQTMVLQIVPSLMTLTKPCLPRLRALAAEAICQNMAGIPDILILVCEEKKKGKKRKKFY